MFVAKLEDDVPVHRFIIMDDDIAKTDRASKTVSQLLGNFVALRQKREGLAHGLRRTQIVLIREPMGRYINAKLYRPGKVQRHNILSVQVFGQ